MDLSQASTATRLTVTGVRTSTEALDRRLAELGLRPGASVQVLRRTAGRGAIVAISDDRLALARSVLSSITVVAADAATSRSLAGAATSRSASSAAMSSSRVALSAQGA